MGRAEAVFVGVVTLVFVACEGGTVRPVEPEFTPEIGVRPENDGEGTEPVDGTGSGDGSCEIQAVFARYNCTGCHDSTPEFNGGELDLISDGLAERLIDRPSLNPSCSNDVLVDLQTPEASLLLRTIAPARYAGFGSADCEAPQMPLVGAENVSSSDVDCIEDWILGLEQPEPIDVPVKGDAFTVLTKTKYLLHGGAITNDELDRVSDENGEILLTELESVIAGWMETPQFREKRRQFLELTLQQTPGDPNYFTQFRNTQTFGFRFVRANLRESLIRTAERIADANEDFRTIVTTNTWEVTTVVLLALKMADNPMILKPSGVWPKGNLANDFTQWDRSNDYLDLGSGGADVTDWRTVTLEHNPDSTDWLTGDALEDELYLELEANAEANLNTLRAVPDGGSIELRAPRIGFFTSPAFFQTWLTNVDNEFRVTLNQALLVATGRTFSPGDTTAINTDLSAVDLEQFPATSECYGCHKNMERMRTAFLANYDSTNTRQYAPGNAVPPPDFTFQGQSVAVDTLEDWANALASHPNFARAWVIKLCQWATSRECEQSDPRVIALAADFEASGFQLNALFRMFFSSSLATDTSYGETTELPGAEVSIARRGHFCHASKERLEGVLSARGREPNSDADICRLNADAEILSSSIPQDAFTRGSAYLYQPKTMEPFTAVAYEGLCSNSAGYVVSPNNSGVFDSTNPNQTLDLLASHVLGFPPGSSRYIAERELLQHLFDTQTAVDPCRDAEALERSLGSSPPNCGLGLTAEQALQNIWTIACQSPAMSGLGLGGGK